ncbi:phage holin family protein [Paenibacillus thermotolerans]|uniref:phage holin family protein n=1 Tax=Paenibacillus thermotolerans TaxID=3027807 RepID=UPI002368251E|nr:MULTISPECIES: phage holin family protein [unclassified Paenibacillus]
MYRLSRILSFENLTTTPASLAAVFGAIVGPVIEILYGGGRGVFLMLLLLLIIGDWITGIAAAKKHDVYSSDYGKTVGTLRTAFMLLLPAIGNWIDKVHQEALGTPGVIFYVLTFGLIYHTWESMTANAYRAGWKKMIPKWVVKFVSSEIKAKTERFMKMQSGNKK